MIKNIEIKIFLISIIIMTGISLIFENIFYKNFQNQFLLFLIPLIWPGLAHGSLDIQIAQRAKIITNNRELSVFLCLYIFLAFIFFLFWQRYPEFSFAIFLLLSIYHFGESDSTLALKKNLSFLEIFARGSLIIGIPTIIYFNDVSTIFKYLNISENFSEIIYFLSIIMISLSIFLILIIIRKITNFKNIKNSFLFEICLITFCFIYFEPLIAFSIYFCFLHSIRHLLREQKYFRITFAELFYKTIPITLLTFIFLISIFIFLDLNTIDFKYLSLTFISLSCLTVPHMILVNRVKKINVLK